MNIAKDLVSCMLKADPTERITAQQALDHPWIVLVRSFTYSYFYLFHLCLLIF